MKRLRNITSLTALQVLTVSSGNVPIGSGNSNNSLVELPVWAKTSGVRLVWENAQLNWGTVSDSADILVQAGMQGFTNSVPKDNNWTQLTPVSILKGYSCICPNYSLDLSYGDTIQVYTYVITTDGGLAPGTRHIWPNSQAVGGDNLTVKTNGETLSSPVSNTVALSPSMVLGMTKTKCLVGMGHSLMVGVEPNGVSWAQRGASGANIPCVIIGKGGSTTTAWNANGNYDAAALAGDVLIMEHVINNINNWCKVDANSGRALTDFISDTTGSILTNIKRFKGLGLKVILATEGFAGTTSTVTQRQIDVRATWNAFVRSSYATILGCDAIFDVSPYLETALDNHVPIDSSYDGLHWNGVAGHTAVGIGLTAALKGSLASLFTIDTDSYEETFVDPFWGPKSTGSTNAEVISNNWSPWMYDNNPGIQLNGVGGLSLKRYTTFPQYLICKTPLKPNGLITAISFPWPSSMISGGNNYNTGLLLGLTETSSSGVTNDERGFSGYRQGYHFRITATNSYAYYYNSVNKGSTNGTIMTNGSFTALVAGDIVRFELYRSVTGMVNTFNWKVFKNTNTTPFVNVTINHTIASTGSTGMVGDIYPSLGVMGNAASYAPTGTALWDFFRLTKLNTTIISDIQTDKALINILPGMRYPIKLTAYDNLGFPADGQVIYAHTDVIGATIASTRETDNLGSAIFTYNDGLNIQPSIPAGTSGNVIFTCGTFTKYLPFYVVDTLDCSCPSGSPIIDNPPSFLLNGLSGSITLIPSGGVQISTSGNSILIYSSLEIPNPQLPFDLNSISGTLTLLPSGNTTIGISGTNLVIYTIPANSWDGLTLLSLSQLTGSVIAIDVNTYNLNLNNQDVIIHSPISEEGLLVTTNSTFFWFKTS